MIASHVGRGPNWIEDLKVAMQHGANRTRLGGVRLCLEEAGGGHGGGTRHSALDKRTARRSHRGFLLATCQQDRHFVLFSWLHRFRHGLWYAASTKQEICRLRNSQEPGNATVL